MYQFNWVFSHLSLNMKTCHRVVQLCDTQGMTAWREYLGGGRVVAQFSFFGILYCQMSDTCSLTYRWHGSLAGDEIFFDQLNKRGDSFLEWKLGLALFCFSFQGVYFFLFMKFASLTKKKRENCLTHETTKAEVVKCFKFQNASGPLTRPAPMESEVALGGPPPQSGLPKSCNSFKLHFKTIQLPNNTQAYILAGEIIQLSII